MRLQISVMVRDEKWNVLAERTVEVDGQETFNDLFCMADG